jgi:hypothetical protein
MMATDQDAALSCSLVDIERILMDLMQMAVDVLYGRKNARKRLIVFPWTALDRRNFGVSKNLQTAVINSAFPDKIKALDLITPANYSES